MVVKDLLWVLIIVKTTRTTSVLMSRRGFHRTTRGRSLVDGDRTRVSRFRLLRRRPNHGPTGPDIHHRNHLRSGTCLEAEGPSRPWLLAGVCLQTEGPSRSWLLDVSKSWQRGRMCTKRFYSFSPLAFVRVTEGNQGPVSRSPRRSRSFPTKRGLWTAVARQA